MDPDTATDAADDIRDDDGCFRPGVSGNPRGRPVGSRRVLHLARTLAAAGIAAVVIVERPGMARPTSATARRPRRLAA